MQDLIQRFLDTKVPVVSCPDPTLFLVSLVSDTHMVFVMVVLMVEEVGWGWGADQGDALTGV